MLVDVFMLAIIGHSDLGQQPSDHLNDVRNWHGTDFILLPDLLLSSQGVPGAMTRSCEDLLASETLYVIQVADLDSGR